MIIKAQCFPEEKGFNNIKRRQRCHLQENNLWRKQFSVCFCGSNFIPSHLHLPSSNLQGLNQYA